MEQTHDCIRNPRNGSYSLTYLPDDHDALYIIERNIIRQELKFYEIIIEKYGISGNLLFYILISSNRKLEKLIIPKNTFYSNVQIKQIFDLIDFDVLTHLDIEIPTLDDEMTDNLIGIINKYKLTHIGIQPNVVVDLNNVRLIRHISRTTTITSLNLYHKMFSTHESVGMIFRALTVRRRCLFNRMMVEISFIADTEPKKMFATRNWLLWMFKKNLVIEMDVRIRTITSSSFLKHLFNICLPMNHTLTKLNIDNDGYDCINALELMQGLYHKNHTITHLKFNFKERKRSIRLRQTNELIQSFCEKNVNLSIKFKTLFQMMIDSVDLDEFNKKQRIQ